MKVTITFKDSRYVPDLEAIKKKLNDKGKISFVLDSPQVEGVEVEA